jgi:hypothetical protein
MLVYVTEIKPINETREVRLMYYDSKWKVAIKDSKKEEFVFEFKNEEAARKSFEYAYKEEMKRMEEC